MGRISEDEGMLWDFYAHFGQVMYQVQLFELSVRGLFSVVDKDVSPALDDGAVEDLFRRPLGKLAKRIGAAESLASDIDKAVDARNQLAHHYILEAIFRVNTSSSSIEQEINDLKVLFIRFENLNEMLEQLQDWHYSNLGIDDTSILSVEEIQRLIAES